MSGTLITELEEGNAKGAVQPVPATTVMVQLHLAQERKIQKRILKITLL